MALATVSLYMLAVGLRTSQHVPGAALLVPQPAIRHVWLLAALYSGGALCRLRCLSHPVKLPFAWTHIRQYVVVTTGTFEALYMITVFEGFMIIRR